MKEVTIKIPKERYDFMMELFGYLKLEVVEVKDLPPSNDK